MHFGMVGANLHLGTSSDDVVHFVFAVRPLGISAAFRQNIDTGAHRRHPKEFHIKFVVLSPPAIQFVDVKEVAHAFLRIRTENWLLPHPIAPRKKISVYWTTRTSPVTGP